MAEQRKGKPRDRGAGPNLAGGGPSIVGTTGAMRARDVSRIRPEDEALAERRLVIKRRPPDATDAPRTP